jgi:hypothetical protein
MLGSPPRSKNTYSTQFFTIAGDGEEAAVGGESGKGHALLSTWFISSFTCTVSLLLYTYQTYLAAVWGRWRFQPHWRHCPTNAGAYGIKVF